VGGCLTHRLGILGSDVAASLTDTFAIDGASQPCLRTATYPAALYSGGTTWVAWEAWNGSARVPTVAGYHNATGYWTDIEAVGVSPLVDDDHGTPAICMDDEGYLHVFYGNHNTAQQYSSTQYPAASPGVGSLWAIREPIAGEYTYPHPVAVGSDIYLFVRKYDSGSTNYPLYLRKTATLAAGVATWNAHVELVDFGASTRFYMGTALKNGTDIWIVATKGAEPDTLREHVYLFVYDTTTGAVKNHDGSFSTASGSLPVALASADTNYRLFTHSGGNNEGGAPSLCFDSNGDPHILFKDGSGNPNGSYAVKHIMRSGGSWTAPTTITTVDNRFNCPTLVPLAGGKVEAWYPLDPLAAYDRFGNIVRQERSGGGTWGSEQTIIAAAAVGLGNPSTVLDGLASARVIYSEAINDATDAAAGDLKMYLYGSGGTIPYVQASDPDTSTETLQLNTENLQLNTEDLTLGV
jgi:hypothetical protein